MNIIFLDVDGVLTYSNYKNNKTENIDINKVKMLKEICDKGNAKIVIISSWRDSKNCTPNIYETLIKILNGNSINVLDDVTSLPYELEDDDNISHLIKFTTLEDLPNLKLKYGTGRAAEVQQYLKEHNVEHFVILDDEDYNWSDYGYDSHWIQPTWFGDGGLKPEHVTKAINILKGKL